MFHVEQKGDDGLQNTAEIIRSMTDVPFGFCPFSAVEAHLLECRAKQRLPKNAKTVICFAFPYRVKEEAPKNISRYAAVPDYHNVCGQRLEKIKAALAEVYPDFCFEAFVDNSPIPEVFAASKAGLGAIGKNGLLITRRFGSFVFLGEIVTDMPVNVSSVEARGCADCGACASACPVGLCKAECLSAVTQQKKPLTEAQSRLIVDNGTVWGCDICQNVCPHNVGTENTSIEKFVSGYRDEYILGENIEGRAYEWRGKRVIERNAELFK